ncbi:MAG: translational GTPase TypA [Planctomycetes bacterium]|nr:translational GTPase TypA [Planctomycetota bacterium]
MPTTELSKPSSERREPSVSHPSMDLRNVAIIAHVDHGKTTLVDSMFRTAGTFRSNQRLEERVMDSNNLERERGITILAKNTAVHWKDCRINIIDTPGHADFGGEVERILSMADGVLLLVDAFEGPMPQTRFVLQKAFENHLHAIVVVNKMDRPDARPAEVLNEVYDLFIELGAHDELLEFPVVYASGRAGWSSLSETEPGTDLVPLLDTILATVPAPKRDVSAPLVFQAVTLDYDDYVGRIAIGRVKRGTLRAGSQVLVRRQSGKDRLAVVKTLYRFEALRRTPTDAIEAGDIGALAGIEEIGIGDVLCSPEHPVDVPPIVVEQPTISMAFSVNNGPLAGKEGEFVTARQVEARLRRAALVDVALKVETTDRSDTFLVSGRGVLHLGILVENMRREGYEFLVGKPRVILREIDGKRCEPVEEAVVETPTDALGRIIEFMGRRRGELVEIKHHHDHARIEFKIPSRGLIGSRTAILTLSQGEARLYHRFLRYEPDRGSFQRRQNGVLVASESGKCAAYALEGLQDRGTFFLKPTDPVYMGQVVGENCKDGDLVVNVCKQKKATNVRSANKEIDVRLAVAKAMGVEEALEYIEDDELVEITPESVRLRKVFLQEKDRKRQPKGTQV